MAIKTRKTSIATIKHGIKEKNRINLVCKNQKLVETLEKQNKCNQNN